MHGRRLKPQIRRLSRFLWSYESSKSSFYGKSITHTQDAMRCSSVNSSRFDYCWLEKQEKSSFFSLFLNSQFNIPLTHHKWILWRFSFSSLLVERVCHPWKVLIITLSFFSLPQPPTINSFFSYFFLRLNASFFYAILMWFNDDMSKAHWICIHKICSKTNVALSFFFFIFCFECSIIFLSSNVMMFNRHLEENWKL